MSVYNIYGQLVIPREFRKYTHNERIVLIANDMVSPIIMGISVGRRYVLNKRLVRLDKQATV